MSTSALVPESKLPSLGTTIFTQMSALAQQHRAINLSQGFPDFDGPDYLKERLAGTSPGRQPICADDRRGAAARSHRRQNRRAVWLATGRHRRSDRHRRRHRSAVRRHQRAGAPRRRSGLLRSQLRQLCAGGHVGRRHTQTHRPAAARVCRGLAGFAAALSPRTRR